jgi:hypothetical protein
MDDFLKAFQEPYEGPYHSDEIFKLTRDSIRDSLNPVFYQMKKAALEGEGSIDIKEELTDDQVWILEKYDYEVQQYDESDEEYEEGFRWNICWFDQNWDPEDEEDETGE